jgi:superfamily II DNA or RNA helicase
MTLHLRDYQVEAVEAVQAAAERGVRRPLVALPTGTGKTVVFSELIRRRGGRALVIAHRDELLEQARDKLRVVDPDLRVGIVQGERDDHDAPVVVASIQTLARERRMARLVGRGGQGSLFPADPFVTVVIDEAHHAAAPTYRAAIAQLGGFDLDAGPLVVGVTATPERGDSVGLDAVFEEIVYQRDLLDMVRAGYLCDLRAVRVYVELDLDRLEVRAGDFGDRELGRALIESAAPEHALSAYRQHAPGRKALIFTPTVEVAQRMADTFDAAGIPARSISGEMAREQRAATLAAFRAGEVRVLANCMILTEGYDEPSVDCLIMARPTRSRPLYVQMVGRGTRRAPGKADCLVIDLLGNSRRHQLMTVASLAGLEPDELAGRTLAGAVAEREEREQGGSDHVAGGQVVGEVVDLFAGSELSWSPGDGFYVLSGGEHGQVVIRQGEAGAWSVTVLPAGGGRSLLLGEGLDLGYAQGVAEDWVRRAGADRLVDRSAAWRSRPASDRQVALLRERGIEVRPGLTAGAASDLIDVAKAAAALAPATPRQLWRLQQMGVATSAGLTKREASALIDETMRRRAGRRVEART